MRPIEFGGCFGWLHPAAGSRGVVLCSSIGYEQLSIHRVWRDLARDIASAGLPTLRFDWHGTGDSVGSDTDPARLAAWLQSLRGAVQCLRQETGVTEVVLVGLRLGASLATLVAQELGGIEGLAMIVPVVSGKSFVREMRALSAFAPVAAADGSASGDLEPAGFVMTAETLADLRPLELTAALATKPANRVLLLHRPAARIDERFIARLVELGCDVTQGDIVDYSDFVCDSEWSRRPNEAFDRLLGWLKEGAAPRAHKSAALPGPVSIKMPGLVEEPLTLAGRASLIATSCLPDAVDPSRPAILFLTTGWYARMGANRMAVTMARRYAQLGIASLRMDFAGVGDSEVAPEGDSLVYNLKSLVDVKAGLDWLEARGHKRVVLFGMCSGAYLGFQAAHRDPRVVGQVLVNAQRFEWTEQDSIAVSGRMTGRAARHLALEALQKAFSPGRWRRLLSGDKAAWGLVHAVRTRVANALRKRLGLKNDTKAAREMRETLKRGIKTLIVFSAGDAGLSESAHQFGPGLELIGRHANLAFETIEGASHTLSEGHSRETMTRLMDRFLEIGGKQAAQARAA